MPTSLGLRENWQQFSLLVIVNAFVGGMVGLERTILPELAKQEFGVAATVSTLSFIVVFGITKAVTNYFTGLFAEKYGRKNLLVTGWLVAIPVPLILIVAPGWSWVVAANILLGINQGLTWSSTVVMKIDLVGPKQRGLAMGINESVGYLAVGIVSFLTGWMAAEYGLRPYPFYLGVFFALVGLGLSFFAVRDTSGHVEEESSTSDLAPTGNIFWKTTWKDRNLGSITQAGLVNNLNDGMMWGLLPIILISASFNLEETGKIVAIYPMVWGLGQLFTGPLSDIFHKRTMLFWGMLIQAVSIALLVPANSFAAYAATAAFLGLGTAIVYPTLLASISQYSAPQQRAETIGIFRLWRDLGYAIGALLTGVVSDIFGISVAVYAIAGITFCSALILRIRMD